MRCISKKLLCVSKAAGIGLLFSWGSFSFQLVDLLSGPA
jgi:hypothetical protein